jgi:hypothetical protein
LLELYLDSWCFVGLWSQYCFLYLFLLPILIWSSFASIATHPFDVYLATTRKKLYEFKGECNLIKIVQNSKVRCCLSSTTAAKSQMDKIFTKRRSATFRSFSETWLIENPKHHRLVCTENMAERANSCCLPVSLKKSRLLPISG